MSEINNIDMFKNDVRFRENIAHIETIPAKKASFKKVDDLNEKIVEYLDSKDIKLYEHQSETYEAIKNGENVIITTPTASGKTLALDKGEFPYTSHMNRECVRDKRVRDEREKDMLHYVYK